MGILHPDFSRFNGPNTPRGRPQQHNVARQTFNGKIFIHSSYDRSVRFRDNRIRRGFRNGTTRSQGCQPAATPRTQLAFKAVITEQRR